MIMFMITNKQQQHEGRCFDCFKVKKFKIKDIFNQNLYKEKINYKDKIEAL